MNCKLSQVFEIPQIGRYLLFVQFCGVVNYNVRTNVEKIIRLFSNFHFNHGTKLRQYII